MARWGMDVDQVEGAAKQLRDQATQIQTAISNLDRVVNGLPHIWEGPDATRFVNEFWPQHKKSLMAAKEAITGLAQSATNNASAQRTASQA
ncbi:WXG100 family type VII secretion target [Smaragdicoccus niigatensis]|uniref:WXG100 family type VII secretion target n=1 Tax=Smaragdicoccus niigatensis TaxID=359359 RepID=UPI000370AFA1|nr:WXG100 family type VII secretion target [Smaragdicoccus niigatensis]